MVSTPTEQLNGLLAAQELLDDDDFSGAQELAAQHDVAGATRVELETNLSKTISFLREILEAPADATRPPPVRDPVTIKISDISITADYADVPRASFLTNLPADQRKQLILQLAIRSLLTSSTPATGAPDIRPLPDARAITQKIAAALKLDDIALLDGMYLNGGVYPISSSPRGKKRTALVTNHTIFATNRTTPVVIQLYFVKKDRPSGAGHTDTLNNNCSVQLRIREVYTNNSLGFYVMPAQYDANFDVNTERDSIFVGSQQYAFAQNSLAARVTKLANARGDTALLPRRATPKETDEVAAAFVRPMGDGSGDTAEDHKAENLTMSWDDKFSLARLPGGPVFEELMRQLPWEADLRTLVEHDLNEILAHSERVSKGANLGVLQPISESAI